MAIVNNDAVLHPFQTGDNTLTGDIATNNTLGLVSIGPSLDITSKGVLSLKYFNLEDIVDKVEARTNLGVHSIEYINTVIESIDTSIEALEVSVETLQTDIATINAQHTNDLIVLNASISTKLDSTANAVSASKLATEITINGIPFDGSESIEIPLTEVNAHIASTANPHGVTKAQVGLGNVNNTSDLDKPISKAVQLSLDTLTENKLDKDSFNTYSVDVDNRFLAITGNTDTSLEALQDTLTTTINSVNADLSSSIADLESRKLEADDLVLASKTEAGITKLSSELSTNDETKAATPKAIKELNDLKLDKTANAVSASKLKDPITISLGGEVTGSASFDGSSNISIAVTLPSYVDDVLEYNTQTDFPVTGEAGKIYIEKAGNTTYRWSGTSYIKITSGEVSSVNGRKGVITLDKTDVGLNNVNNTTDLDKPISTLVQEALDTKVSNAELTTATNALSDSIVDLETQITNGLNTKLDKNSNAVSATKLNTARSLTVGNTGKNFDGSNNVSWSLTEIGAAPAVHTHDYLPLTGGSITGTAASTSATTGALVVAGGVGIGGAVFTAGAITAAGNVTAYSDKRIKSDILPVEDVVAKLSTLQGITFTRNDIESDRRYVGLIAQDVQAIIPEAITILDDERKTLTVDYQGLVGVLVEAIKELNQRIEILEGR